MSSKPSSILRTGLLLVGVPIAFQLGALAYLLSVQTATAAAEQRALHSKDVLARADSLAFTLSQAHSAIRASAVFENTEFESQRRQAASALPAQLDALRGAVADNPAQQARVDLVRRDVAAYLSWFREMEGLAAADRWAGLRGALVSGRGKDLLDAVEHSLSAFLAEEERIDASRRVEASRSRVRERTVLGAIAGVAVLLAVGMLLVFTSGLSRRIARISVNGQRLATGDPLLEPLPGTDEVAALDAVLHQSAARLAAAAEAEHRHLEELEERREALERTNQDLTFKTQENEMFVYSVSHDLRSPLVNLQGFTKELTQACDLLRVTVSGMSVPPADRAGLLDLVERDMGESIGFIQSAVTRLSGIVDALLRLSRAGRVEFSNQPVDLAAIADRVVRAMRATIDEHGADVSVAALPSAAGDPVAIEQVLANLVGNALNYLDPGRPGRVHVGALRPDAAQGRVTVFVRDNGLGIPTRYLGKLFMPFERLHGSTVKGEGIGLALSKRIVERLGGRIWAESTEGEGSTFFVSLLLPGASRRVGAAVASEARAVAPTPPRA